MTVSKLLPHDVRLLREAAVLGRRVPHAGFRPQGAALVDPDTLDRVLDELERLRGLLDLAQERKTMGGIPRDLTNRWANADLPPPPTATDPTAPPLHRGPDTQSINSPKL